jgi:DNA-binding beta-propeller fold protein YncE
MQKAIAPSLAVLFAFSTPGLRTAAAPVVTPPTAPSQLTVPLRLLQTIPLPNVDGFLDHMGVDVQGERLFVPTEVQKTVEVVDLRAGKVVHTITGLSNPHTVLYRAESNELFVTDAKEGTCEVFRGDSYEPLKSIKLAEGADNAAYDPVSQYFYIDIRGQFTKSPTSLLAIVDTKRGEHLGDIKIDGANTQAMAFEPSGPTMYLDVADQNRIDIIDREKRAVVGSWSVAEAPWNYTLALDAPHHRLFVASRIERQYFAPGKLLVLDSETGKVITRLDIAGGADETFYDSAHRRIYIAGGDGFVDVIQQLDADHYQSLGRIATGVLAKTALWVPEFNRLYVAVQQHQVVVAPMTTGKFEQGKILVYEAEP